MSKRDDLIQLIYEWWLRNGESKVIAGAARDELMDMLYELLMKSEKAVDEP